MLRKMFYKKFFKRIFDFAAAGVALVILSPLLLILWILVAVMLGRPVLFLQKRPGKGAKIFTIYKFRTMTDKRDNSGRLLPDEHRLTKFGKFLRATSLDELPELINVLNGQMSLVGPRPLLVEYLEFYSPIQSRRHEVRPGITGWAQVNGRNAVGWEDRFAMDVWYVDNLSFALDIKIIFETVIKVLQRKGISSPNSATMEPFAPVQNEPKQSATI